MSVPPARVRSLPTLLAVVALTIAACGSGDDDTYFATLAPGAALPDDETCSQTVSAVSSIETHPENRDPNATVDAPDVPIDGVLLDEAGGDGDAGELAARLSGDFTGTTEQILRWGSCKWGFDEDITRARAVTESSWSMNTAGDVTEDATDCHFLGLEPPCPRSYGLLQVKGTVHVGTYPASARATAFGVDYAMAWLRGCYEGEFTWLDDQGYEAGDEWGCVGAWFSGDWWDRDAADYVDEVRGHLENRTWEEYAPVGAALDG